jgi:hypothetical protein
MSGLSDPTHAWCYCAKILGYFIISLTEFVHTLVGTISLSTGVLWDVRNNSTGVKTCNDNTRGVK